MDAGNEASVTGGPAAPVDGAGDADIVKLLNDALATELVCVLRYKRHQFTADALAMPKFAREFLGYANDESAHADRLAQRIVQLGGEPDFSPDTLSRRSHVGYDDSPNLKSMIEASLVGERQVMESYSRIIKWIGDRDSATRHLVEDILSDELEQAEELKELLSDAG